MELILSSVRELPSFALHYLCYLSPGDLSWHSESQGYNGCCELPLAVCSSCSLCLLLDPAELWDPTAVLCVPGQWVSWSEPAPNLCAPPSRALLWAGRVFWGGCWLSAVVL